MLNAGSNQDHLRPEDVSARLPHTIFSRFENIRHFDAIGSTNTAAMQAAMQGAPEGTLFIAEEQLSGRGRGGHSWHSESGSGIYLSVVLRPNFKPPALLTLSLIAGIAVHDAIRDVCGITPDLRWPNDVLIGNKKVAGILTETSADLNSIHHAVIGIGINVNHSSFPPELAEQATSILLATGHSWPRLELLIALLESLDNQYRALNLDPAGQTAKIIAEFEAKSSYVREAWISVHERDAAQPEYTGKTLGLDSRGFLKIQTDSGVRTLLNGGIRKVNAVDTL
jgi:BirA family biotin operon repressor/biotin-[acetyl-CoA-carboxylase] ligase